MRQRGFTLLEMLVATLIMGVAVVTLLSGISASLRNVSRLTEYGRVVLLARSRMDALLADGTLPETATLEGSFTPAEMGGGSGGWRARVTPFEPPPNPGPNAQSLDRLELEVWWMSGARQRTFALEGFRSRIMGQRR